MTGGRRTELDELRNLDALERKHAEEVGRFLESKPSGETVTLTPDQLAARNKRNLWIALSIGAFMALVFAITMVQMQAGIAVGPS